MFRGIRALVHANFFTQDMSDAGPLEPLTVGGIRHAAIGTLEQIALALLVTVPLGITCAVYLSETRGRFALLVRTVVDTMTAARSPYGRASC
jgi:phosphate transport system permease protein